MTRASWKDEKVEGFVYKWTHKANGKWYIGSHNGKKPSYMGSGLAFQQAVAKYGKDEFVREILYRGYDFRRKEEEILKELNAANDPQSYNIKNEALGGSFTGEKNGMANKSHSKESKLKISAASKSQWNEETRAKKSIEMTGQGNPMFGRKKSEFSLQKERQTKMMKQEEWGFLGDPNGKSHKVHFMKIFRDLRDFGKEVSPRGQLVREIENYSYELPPYVRFQNFEQRKMNLSYIKKEFLWYLRGDRFDLSICNEAKIWGSIVNEDRSLNSNYGQYVFGSINQFDNAAKVLKEDKDSRRASIMILNSDHVLSDTKDLPCTYSINFRIRNDCLNMSVRMRSQDAIFGATNDIPTFSFIHEMMFVTLKEAYPDLQYGSYHHTADSFHIYQRHFDMLEKLLAEKDGKVRGDHYSLVLCPRISGPQEVLFLRQYALLEPEERAKTLSYNLLPESYKFTKWMIDV